jgi:hypothetical protein
MSTLLRPVALLFLTVAALLAGGPAVEIVDAEIHSVTVEGSRVVVTFTGTVRFFVRTSTDGTDATWIQVSAVRATLTAEHAAKEYLPSEAGQRTYRARMLALVGQRVPRMQGWYARTTIADAAVTEVRVGECPFLAPTSDERMFVLQPTQPKPEQP